MGWRGAAPPFYPSSAHTALDRVQLSEVVPKKLYLTNFKGAADRCALETLGVTHVAAVGAEFVEHTSEALVYWNKDITDDAHQGEAMAGALRDGASFIHNAISGGGCVVVHCAAGISRSATVVLGYFILHREETLRQAFERVYNVRPCVWPNEGFMQSLIALEEEVRGKPSTITASEYDQWGDYDGPDEGSSGAPPMGLPRFVRDDTCLEDEMHELAVLEAKARGEDIFATKLQRRARLWLAERGVLGPSRGSGGIREPSCKAEPSSKAPKLGARRVSLTKAERSEAAAEASMEAWEASVGAKQLKLLPPEGQHPPLRKSGTRTGSSTWRRPGALLMRVLFKSSSTLVNGIKSTKALLEQSVKPKKEKKKAKAAKAAKAKDKATAKASKPKAPSAAKTEKGGKASRRVAPA